MSVYRIGAIGDIIDYLNEKFDSGEISGIAVALKTKADGDQSHSFGDMTFFWDGFGNYAEQIGASVMLRECMLKKALDES